MTLRTALKPCDDIETLRCDSLVVPVYDDKKLLPSARTLDKASKKFLSRVINSDDVSGSAGETTVLPLVVGNNSQRIILWGLGERDTLDRLQWTNACNALAAVLTKQKGDHAALATDIKPGKKLPLEWAQQQLVTSIVKYSYRYMRTKKPAAKNARPALKKLTLLSTTPDATQRKALKRGAAIGEGVNTARELGNLPANICTPKYLSSEARKLSRKHEKMSVSILGEKQMRELEMGALLSVGEGSVQESQLIVLNYRGGRKTDKPQVLVGKGITFDTGGISLKPGGKMDEMKFDMCGAASVLGTLTAIADMGLPINVIGVIAAAENMPAGNATKPGDVVTSMAGKTIEVLNTDAEGRLVLCDALHYVKRFKPEAVVDMATLTGACIVALGHHASGLMSNDDDLAQQLLDAGNTSTDRAWRLPLWNEYRKQLDSPFADLANIGGPSAGTITAGCFLGQFTNDYRWAHLDIAGTAWNQGGGKSASGRPVALLCQYLIDRATP